MLPNGIRFHINDVLYYGKSTRNLKISVKMYIPLKPLMQVIQIVFILLLVIVLKKKLVIEKLLAISYGLLQTTIKHIESYIVMNYKFNDPKIVIILLDK